MRYHHKEEYMHYGSPRRRDKKEERLFEEIMAKKCLKAGEEKVHLVSRIPVNSNKDEPRVNIQTILRL